jgi:hypothetical protein
MRRWRWCRSTRRGIDDGKPVVFARIFNVNVVWRQRLRVVVLLLLLLLSFRLI